MKNPYVPKPAEIKEVRNESPDIKTFRIAVKDFNYVPGQFIELSVFGYGEIPISITSTPTLKDSIELSIKNVGRVTKVMHEAEPGDTVGIRGPYGNGWPVKELRGKDLLFIGGGIGLAPLRSFINYVKDNRNQYGNVSILYGARSPDDMVFRYEYGDWEKVFDLHLTVDREFEGWKGNVCFVHELLKDVKSNIKNAHALICGPSVMMKCVVSELKSMWFRDERIILSFERMMKCGIGKCGHCNIGEKYVCVDGPVFTYDEIKDNPEKWG